MKYLCIFLQQKSHCHITVHTGHDHTCYVLGNQHLFLDFFFSDYFSSLSTKRIETTHPRFEWAIRSMKTWSCSITVLRIMRVSDRSLVDN